MFTPIAILNTLPEHAEACGMLEQVCYPSLSDDEKIRPEQFHRHITQFPAGQFVALDTRSGRVVGCTGGFRTTVETVLAHNFFDMTSHGWFTRHDSDAAWYHGATMTVHPDYRGRGIARKFYEARKAMCRALGLRGQVICGMIPGFAAHKGAMSAQDYVRTVQRGALVDPTLTVQLRNDFVFERLIADYFVDPPSQGWAVLMTWKTPAEV